jgi:hypothetical protein
MFSDDVFLIGNDILNRLKQITSILGLPNYDLDDDSREKSVSPPPVYNKQGQRINTRKLRRKDALEKEKKDLQLLLRQFSDEKSGPVFPLSVPVGGNSMFQVKV